MNEEMVTPQDGNSIDSEDKKVAESTAPQQIKPGILYFRDKEDRQEYKVARMPDGKIWMAQNFNRKTKTSWCYDNVESNGDTYGRLYTWKEAVSTCPGDGWHLPSINEWNTMVNFLSLKNVSDGKMISLHETLKDTNGWNSLGTDGCGFSALPCGMRTKEGAFMGLGVRSIWWLKENSDLGGCAATVCICDCACGVFSNIKVGCGCSVRYVHD